MLPDFGRDAPIDPALAERAAAERVMSVPGENEAYPHLSSVPDEAPAVVPADERDEIADGLAAARDGGGLSRGPSSMMVGDAVHAAVIYYNHGSTRLSSEDKEVLQRVANMSQIRDADVRVVGHASSRTASSDQVGAKIANFRIALTRARKVGEELARLGVPNSRIFIESRAANDPAWSYETPLGEAANRRTDIYFVRSSGAR